MGFLREAGFAGEPARQHRTAVPAVEESFCLQRPHVPPYGHFGGLDDAGELPERYRPVGAHHFEDQLTTFCSEHETDSNPNDHLLSAVCAELQILFARHHREWYKPGPTPRLSPLRRPYGCATDGPLRRSSRKERG